MRTILEEELMENQVSQPAAESSMESSTQKQTQNTSTIWKMVSVILFLILAALSLYCYQLTTELRRSKEFADSLSEVVKQKVPDSVNLTPSPMENISRMTKKHFKTTDNFMGEGYPFPDEVLNLKDQNLVAFSCSKKYLKQEDGTFADIEHDRQTNQQKAEDFQNPEILTYLKKLESDQTMNGSLYAVMTCETEDGRILLIYDVFPQAISGGGGLGTDVYIGFFDGKGAATAKISREKGPYFTCMDALAITKDNLVYALCGAGDGGYGSRSIYKVGLYKAYSTDLLLKCVSQANPDAGKTETTCGTKP